MITIEQCRAARGLLDWTQQDLADASGLSKTAINNFEKGHSDIKAESLRAIRMAFETAHIEFFENEGLRRRTETVKIVKGSTAFSSLLDDIFETLKDKGGEVLMNNVNESIISQTSPKKILQHLERLKDHRISERVLCAEGSSTMLAPMASCRWLASDFISQGMTSFIYDKKVAFELWENAMILIVDSTEASNAERLRFESSWASAQIPPSQSKDTLTRQTS